jgi:hypothetical protein
MCEQIHDDLDDEISTINNDCQKMGVLRVLSAADVSMQNFDELFW